MARVGIRAAGVVLFLIVVIVAIRAGDDSRRATPTVPFGQPITGTEIQILEPFDTTKSEMVPRHIGHGPSVVAGEQRFVWTPVERADRYVVLIQDLAGFVPNEVTQLGTYANVETDEPTAEIELSLRPDISTERRELMLQVFAYAGVELIGQSDLWPFFVVSE